MTTLLLLICSIKNSQIIFLRRSLTLLNAPSLNQSDQMFNASFIDTYSALATSNNSSAGHDGISGRILHNLAHVIALPISIIFHQSLAQGIFPSAWKVATVILIYKGKGARDDASTFRPISLCLTIGKALERIVGEQFLSAIVKTTPLCNLQHGFFNGRSTVTNLLCAENITADAINSKEPYDIISFDFSRAFDPVPHHLLLQDLADRGISGKALEWMQSSLSERTQTMRVGSAHSVKSTVTSGVI